jgi:ABC-2 type transport system ATP-binding protein
MLEVRNLHKRYTGIPAVDAVSFVARAGEVTGYLGTNGSGKSTTMKMATGLIEPNEGEILFEGNGSRKPDGLSREARSAIGSDAVTAHRVMRTREIANMDLLEE